MKEIAQAYSVLSNPEDRKIYDQFGDQGLARRNSIQNDFPSFVALDSVTFFFDNLSFFFWNFLN